MNETKITAKIYEPLLYGFNKQLTSLHLKRDSFVNAMIKSEIKHLAKDVKGKKLSIKAKRYISGELKRMGTVTVNIVVDKETADSLSVVVENSNIVRDAFLNRLIMLLRASDALLKTLGLPISYRELDSSFEAMPNSPLKAIESIMSDPLYYLREACEDKYELGLYSILLPKKLHGFSCYIEDENVPGTVEFEKMQKMGDELLLQLESLEAGLDEETQGDK